ncbi:hypothetical protein OPV22_026615 [Ensete ventricosum]|uniref:RING-type domain-containing protein n=1 Tax=Ensete ventricosum TaxID=4639 RepID=A0AAV8QII4_ENSVE|nr:hypothetical protein OPV22_026615 [Ensete ventricosum]
MDAVILAAVASVLLGVGGLVLVQFCIVRRAIRRGFLGFGATSGPSDDACDGLPPQLLQRLPCYDFKEGCGAECAVCLESLEVGDVCRLLPACMHTFHARCVDCWLLQKPICPTCRTSAAPGGAAVVAEVGGMRSSNPKFDRQDLSLQIPSSCLELSNSLPSNISY